MIVSGAQDGLSKTFEAILGPGDSLLVHDPFYPGVQVVVSNSQAVFQLCRDSLDSPRLNYRESRSGALLVKQKEMLALSFAINGGTEWKTKIWIREALTTREGTMFLTREISNHEFGKIEVEEIFIYFTIIKKYLFLCNWLEVSVRLNLSILTPCRKNVSSRRDKIIQKDTRQICFLTSLMLLIFLRWTSFYVSSVGHFQFYAK